MAVTTNPHHVLNTLARPEGPATIPSPAQVRAAAAEIRKSWTPHQRRRRAKLARYLLWRQVLVGTPADRPPTTDGPQGVTPKCSPRHS
jgi:hypothetical protein